MISSVLNVQENFFKRFTNLKITQKDGSELTIPCRYARKSSEDYTEEQEQQDYPCIAIQDYIPRPKDNYYVDLRKYQGATNLTKTLVELVRKPMWMDFTFDVSIVSKSFFEYQKILDLFIQNFTSDQRFLFNSVLIDTDDVGDVVPYTINQTDITRTDGCHESNFEFTLSVWMQITKVEEVDVIQQINVRPNVISLENALLNVNYWNTILNS